MRECCTTRYSFRHDQEDRVIDTPSLEPSGSGRSAVRGQSGSEPLQSNGTGPGSPGDFAAEDIHSPSMADLVDAYREHGRPRFNKVRRSFEKEHGKIVEYYFSRNVQAGAVLLRRPSRVRPFGQTFSIMMSYDGTAAPPALAEELRAVRREERQSAILLQGRARHIVVQTAYSLIVYLLNALDCLGADTCPISPAGGALEVSTIDRAVESTRRELDGMREFAHAAARRAALWHYLLGLPLGAVTGIGLITATYSSRTVGALADHTVVATCLAGGAIGAVISVMVRVTRGTTLDVDFNRGRGVTLLAGSFRPIIGAVFGGVLFVLILGGLVPFAVPPVGTLAVTAPERTSFFFIGLSFLAGFSERWAQDTIVNSAPRIPSTRRSDPDSDAPEPS
jgi:hypothetical protein